MNADQHEPGQNDGGSADDTIHLGHYLVVLWRHRLAVAVGTVACGVATIVASALMRPTYEATVKLIITPPKTGATNETMPAISAATFRALVENQSLSAGVVQEFGLDKPPYKVTPGYFTSNLLTVQQIRDTNVIVVKVRLWDPDLSAKVANRLAHAAEELARRLNQEETVTARDVIKAQLDVSQQRLKDAEDRFESFKRKAQLELLRKDIEAMLSLRGTLIPLLVDIQSEKARLSQAEALLKEKDKVDTLKRSIDTDPAAMEVARRTGAESGSVLPLQLRNEVINPVYESLDQVVATSRTRLAGLEKQKSELIDVRKLDANEQKQLDVLYERETELSRLQTEYDISKANYMDVSTRYEQARIQVAGRSAQLQIMDTALPPDRPIAPRLLAYTALALALGFSMMVIVVLLSDALVRSVAREQALRAPGHVHGA